MIEQYDSVLWLHGIILTVLAVGFLLWHLRTGGMLVDAVSISWVGYILWVSLAVAGAAYYGTGRAAPEARGFTLLMIYVGTLAYFAGLSFRRLGARLARWLPVPRDSLTAPRLWFLLILLAGVWVIGFVLLYGGFLRAAALFLIDGGAGGVGILAVIGLIAFRGRPISRFLMLFVLAAALVVLVSTEWSRRPAPAILMACFLLLYHVKLRYSTLAAKIVTLMTMSVAGFGLLIYLTQTRAERHYGSVARTQERTAAETLGELITIHSGYSYVVLEHIVATTPSEFPYLYGKGIVPLFTFMIPRDLWPGKPTASGYTYSVRFLGVDPPYKTVAAMIFGEWYCNFGPLGVLVGMMLVGVVVRMLSDVLHARQDNLVVMATWFVVVPDFMTEWRGDLTSMTIQGLLKGLLLLFLCWIGTILHAPEEKLLSVMCGIRRQSEWSYETPVATVAW